MIQKFPYVRMDYHDDRDMILPPGEQWDDSGKNHFQHFLSFNFLFFLVNCPKLTIKSLNADVGPRQPATL